MFTRNVQFEIKSGKEQELKTTIEREILPVLKNQPGFMNEVLLVDSNRAVGISFWDDRQHLEAYQNGDSAKVLKKIEPLINGAPTVKTFRVAASTLAA